MLMEPPSLYPRLATNSSRFKNDYRSSLALPNQNKRRPEVGVRLFATDFGDLFGGTEDTMVRVVHWVGLGLFD